MTTGVYKAIAKVQAEVAKEGIGKDRDNKQQGYKFRGIDDIYNALASKLATAGLCILPRFSEPARTERKSNSGGVLFCVTIHGEFDFVAAEDGSKHTVTVFGEAMDSGDKATNKAMSAAYKYACLQTFCIPTEGDNDADATTHEVAESPAPTPPKKAQNPQLAAYNEAKAEYAIACAVRPDGTLDYDGFAAELENAVSSAGSMNELSMLKKANAKTLNNMKVDRPDLFDFLKGLFTEHSNVYA